MPSGRTRPRVALIIPAAGSGTRMKNAVRKPFLELAGRPILHLTLERFLNIPGITQVIIAVNPADCARGGEMLAEMAPLGVTDVVEGGASRTESVANCLAALAGNVDIVLVHDAVRPFVREEVILGVIAAAVERGAAIAAAPVRDTIKRVDGGMITGTVPRKGLYLAQTPQGFQRAILEAAYRNRPAREFTDDAELVEATGAAGATGEGWGGVAVVESTYDNFKITTPEDLAVARAVCGEAGRGGGDKFSEKP